MQGHSGFRTFQLATVLISPTRTLTSSILDTIDTILARFADAGSFTPAEVVALLGSHSVAGADDIDPTVSTPS